ncbi:hypothetical protein ACUWE6_17375 [Bacillus subtilis subsp. subtilis]
MAGRDQASPAGSAKRNCRYRRENQTARENLTKLISYSKEKNAGQNWTRIFFGRKTLSSQWFVNLLKNSYIFIFINLYFIGIIEKKKKRSR